MNTKLNKAGINPEFEDLFSFKSDKEKIEHMSQMISYRILSEVEKICDEKNIKKKDLAEMIGTSRSYITQLFRGTKYVNTDVMAKFECALDFTYNIVAKRNEDSHEDFLAKQLPVGFFRSKRVQQNGFVLYCIPCNKEKTTEDELVVSLETENSAIQKAG
jgi:transcriptional regulator with XRE-family HTH domain